MRRQEKNENEMMRPLSQSFIEPLQNITYKTFPTLLDSIHKKPKITRKSKRLGVQDKFYK